MTVYKYQGGEMDKTQMCTALSRTTKFEYIHLGEKSYYNRKSPELELTNSKIYEVIFDNELIYVGSTCEELETRLKWHKTNKKKKSGVQIQK